MAPPIYFFPNLAVSELVKQDKFDQQAIASRGLGGVLGDLVRVRERCSLFELVKPGPGGATGTLLSVTGGKSPQRMGYYPESQDWHERPVGMDVWVGIDREMPPTPDDLARGERLYGYAVEMGDGCNWVVPVIRCPFGREAFGQSSLPMDYTYRSGHAEQVICEDYRELWELTGQAWDHWYDRESQPEMDLDVLLRIAVESLGINYRYGKVEQTVLRLVNSRNWEDVLAAVLDVPLLAAEMKNRNGKKKDSLQAHASSSSTHGHEGTCQATDRAVAS